MHWLKSSAERTEDFGAGRPNGGALEVSDEVVRSYSHEAEQLQRLEKRVKALEAMPSRGPIPKVASSPPAGQAESLRDWVTGSLDALRRSVQEELGDFRTRIEASEKANREILTTLSKTVKEGSEQIKRVSSTTMAMEEKVNGLTFDGDAFRQLRLEVEEAVQYLQAQCERVEQDCKDLDYRMSVQALAASTFSLKVVSMDAATREKSLKYLAGEEKRVKAKASPQTKAAMAARQTTSPRATAVAQRAEGPRPTGQVRSVSPDSTPQTSPRGPGPLNEERRETPGLAEALVSEVFCLEAAELSESERKMCVSLLKQRLAGLRSSTLNKEILEEIHQEALRYSQHDAIQHL